MTYSPGDVIHIKKMYQTLYGFHRMYVVLSVDPPLTNFLNGDAIFTFNVLSDESDTGVTQVFDDMVDKRYGKKRN